MILIIYICNIIANKFLVHAWEDKKYVHGIIYKVYNCYVNVVFVFSESLFSATFVVGGKLKEFNNTRLCVQSDISNKIRST